ncbi:ABC transporter permease [Actinomadura livida]|uniref:ABC transporter permease n=1 Tax=Actinomadura livida TaxID=79909 RepID=A0A7W7MX59_9ACTN|nr:MULTISPECIES: ABC transporter permease [Actinomadura]MBB4773587.1 putative ABC transport system permease protein [Actinomadura catellatispora]GGU09346.1 ABC transporter substrate-binding protein [Actinomadura livida]
MFLALRELRFAKVRFGLMGAVVALIAVLMVMLSGLSVGLVRDGVSGLQNLPVTSFAFERGVQHDAAFSRSVVDVSAVDAWRSRPGVAEAAPYGNALINAKSDRGVDIDLALFGVAPDSFLSPEVSEGSRLNGPDGIVVAGTALDAGLRIGDTITVDRLGTKLRVIGATGGQDTFGHVDVAYVPLPAWQLIKAGVRQGGTVPEQATRDITAVAVRAEPGASVDLAAGDAAAGTESLTLEESYGASPGYTAETSTLQLIQGFLYAISALVVGAFFAVWAIQRRHEVAVLRAMGASRSWLLRDALTQAFLLLVAAVAIGAGIGVGLGSLITGGGVPFALSAPSVTAAAAGIVMLGLVGAGAAVARIASIDPATALGGNR